MTTLTSRIRATRQTVSRWTAFDAELIADPANWPAADMFTKFVASLAVPRVIYPTQPEIAESLLTFTLLRLEERIAMLCFDQDDEERWFDNYQFDRRVNHFDQFTAEYASGGILDIAYQDAHWEQWQTQIHQATAIPAVNGAIRHVQFAFQSVQPMPLVKAVARAG